MEAQPDDSLRQALALNEQGRTAEALACLDGCLRGNPGWVPARCMRAAALVELGRYAEAREELTELLALQPESREVLRELKAACDAALAQPVSALKLAPGPGPAVDTLPRPVVRAPGSNVIPIACSANEAAAVTLAWARRMTAALEQRFVGRFPVRWWQESSIASGSGFIVVIALGAEGRLAGQVRVAWDHGKPEELRILTDLDGIKRAASLAERCAWSLAVVGLLAGFAFWIWLIIHDWERIWNRISFSSQSPRASKLELFCLVGLGWLWAPALGFMPLAFLASSLQSAGERRDLARRATFYRNELDEAIAQAIDQQLEETVRSAKVAAELGRSGVA